MKQAVRQSVGLQSTDRARRIFPFIAQRVKELDADQRNDVALARPRVSRRVAEPRTGMVMWTRYASRWLQRTMCTSVASACPTRPLGILQSLVRTGPVAR